MLIQKEQSHQYLIIAQTPEMDEFVLRMILENNIPGLVGVKQRMFNGEMNLYYEITGKCPLSDRSIRLSGTDTRALLQSLLLVTEKLSSYFLPEDYISFTPDLVFSQNGAWFFCYIPKEEDDLRENCIRFSEELLGRIDQEDEQAVVLAYQFYRMIKRENDTLHHVILELLCGEETRQGDGMIQAAFQDRGESVQGTLHEGSQLQQKYFPGRSDQADNNLCADMQKRKVAGTDDGLQGKVHQIEPDDALSLSVAEDDPDAGRRESPAVDLFALLLFVLLLCGSMGVCCYLIFVWKVGSFRDFLSLREGILCVVFLLLSLGGIIVTCLPAMLQRISGSGEWKRHKGQKQSREKKLKDGKRHIFGRKKEEAEDEDDVFEIPPIDLK